MHSTSERFKPAGHRAQDLSEIVLPEEKFPAVRRITRRDDQATIGYVFPLVENHDNVVDDVVMSADILRHRHGAPAYRTPERWKEYEKDDKMNRIGWAVPTARLVLELAYRTALSEIPPTGERKSMWHRIFSNTILTSTTVTHVKNSASVRERDLTPVRTSRAEGLHYFDGLSPSLPLGTLAYALFGKRSGNAEKVFGMYADEVLLYPLPQWTEGKCCVTLGRTRQRQSRVFSINTTGNPKHGYKTIGVTTLTNILKNKRYEVRDE